MCKLCDMSTNLHRTLLALGTFFAKLLELITLSHSILDHFLIIYKLINFNLNGILFPIMADNPHLPYCLECGEARIAHGFAKVDDAVSIAVDLCFVRPTARIRNHITSLFKKIPYDKSLSKFFLILARLGVGQISYALNDNDSIRTKALWESAEELGIKLFTYRISDRLPYGITVAKYAKDTLTYQDVPRPKGWSSPSLEWMDDKSVLKKKLIKAGLPTAKGGLIFTQRGALSLFSNLTSPVIIKPHLGTRGRHTTLSLVTQEDVLRAFAIGKEIAVGLVLEEELQGNLYRVTLIGGEPVAVARRDFPHVVGDGVSTIKELIDITNSDKRRDGFSFYPILDNDRMTHQLNLQKLTKSSIPESGRLVVLNDKVSRLHGTTTVDVTETVHSECMDLFRRIGVFLGDAVVGVDFIIGDITRSPSGQSRHGVVECNAMPYIDLHHYPFEGQPRPVAQELWKLCFPKLKNKS